MGRWMDPCVGVEIDVWLGRDIDGWVDGWIDVGGRCD